MRRSDDRGSTADSHTLEAERWSRHRPHATSPHLDRREARVLDLRLPPAPVGHRERRSPLDVAE
jgi:hypothetical protein